MGIPVVILAKARIHSGQGDACLPHHIPVHPPLLCRFFGLRSLVPPYASEGGVLIPSLPLWIPASAGMTMRLTPAVSSSQGVRAHF